MNQTKGTIYKTKRYKFILIGNNYVHTNCFILSTLFLLIEPAALGKGSFRNLARLPIFLGSQEQRHTLRIRESGVPDHKYHVSDPH